MPWEGGGAATGEGRGGEGHTRVKILQVATQNLTSNKQQKQSHAGTALYSNLHEHSSHSIFPNSMLVIGTLLRKTF